MSQKSSAKKAAAEAEATRLHDEKEAREFRRLDARVTELSESVAATLTRVIGGPPLTRCGSLLGAAAAEGAGHAPVIVVRLCWPIGFARLALAARARGGWDRSAHCVEGVDRGSRVERQGRGCAVRREHVWERERAISRERQS